MSTLPLTITSTAGKEMLIAKHVISVETSRDAYLVVSLHHLLQQVETK